MQSQENLKEEDTESNISATKQEMIRIKRANQVKEPNSSIER